MSDNVIDLPARSNPVSDPILRCQGVGRDAENNRVLFFSFDRPPTDNEMRFLHDVMKRAAICARSGDDAHD